MCIRDRKYAGLTGEPEEFVEIDENFKRPAEVDLLVGDSSKALIKLGWKPRMNFNQLVKKMVDNDLL